MEQYESIIRGIVGVLFILMCLGIFVAVWRSARRAKRPIWKHVKAELGIKPPVYIDYNASLDETVRKISEKYDSKEEVIEKIVFWAKELHVKCFNQYVDRFARSRDRWAILLIILLFIIVAMVLPGSFETAW